MIHTHHNGSASKRSNDHHCSEPVSIPNAVIPLIRLILLLHHLACHKLTARSLSLRFRFYIAAAGVWRALLQRDALTTGARVRWPDGRPRQLEGVRIARADEGEPIRDEFFRERGLSGRHRRKRRRSVEPDSMQGHEHPYRPQLLPIRR